MSICVKIERLSRTASGPLEPEAGSPPFELEVDTSYARGRLSFQARGRWSETLSQAVDGSRLVRVSWCGRVKAFRVGSCRAAGGRMWVEFLPMEPSGGD
jgi:hypothetical protein